MTIKTLKFLTVVFLVTLFTFTSFARLARRPRVQVKDFASRAKVESLRIRVVDFLKDKGPNFKPLSETMSRVVEKCGRISQLSVREKAAESLDGALKGLEKSSPENQDLQKVGEALENVFDQAIALREGTLSSEPKAVEVSNLLFVFAAERIPEQLENPQFEYSIGKINEAAKIVKSKLGVSNPSLEALHETIEALKRKFNYAESIEEIIRCRRG